MAATIVETGTAFPEFEYDQAAVKRRLVAWLESGGAAGRSGLSTLDTNLVARRRLALPIDEVFAERRFSEKNDDYIRHATILGEKAVLACLGKAGLAPGDVDYFVSTSCTGFTIPSLDALIAHRLGMKTTLSRLPITEHGCAAGAVALSQASVWLAAHPDHRVLVLSVELASLTFQTRDFSAGNIVSAGLFGDGAVAVILSSEPRPRRPAIVAAGSRFFPNSASLMGFRLTDGGLKIVLSRDIPDAIRTHAVPALASFLDHHGLTPQKVDHWLLHPGGRKIVESFEDAFDLGRGGLQLSRQVLRDRGNLSSATVLCLLDDLLSQDSAEPGDTGVLVAFGPGFGAEMLLLKF